MKKISAYIPVKDMLRRSRNVLASMRSASVTGNRQHRKALNTAVKSVGASRFKVLGSRSSRSSIRTGVATDVLLFVFDTTAPPPPSRTRAFSFTRFLDHKQRRTTVDRTPLDEWSASRRDLYLTTHNTHDRKTFISPVGFEFTISAGQRPQPYALDRAATLIGLLTMYFV